jgi:hypothetical protein
MTRPAWLALFSILALACGDDDALVSSSSSSSERDGGAQKQPRTEAKIDAGRAPASAAPVTSRDPVKPRGDAQAGDEVCDAIKIPSGRVTPDMLIVLDRSTSMKNAQVNRWDPSVSGIKAFTSALDASVNFGLMAFPGSGAMAPRTGGLRGGGGMACAAGTVEVEVGPRASAAIAARLDQLELVQSTPTASTLQAAHQALKKLAAPGDGAAPKLYVVLVTDGSPNCSNGMLGGGGGDDQQAVQDSIAAIAAMAKEDIKTYVVGFGTQGDPQLKSALDAMAQAGGTGDQAHRPIEDEAGLLAAFREISKTAVTCDYELGAPVNDPTYVDVQISGNAVRYNDPDGWVLGMDRRTLTLQGAACDSLANASVGTALSVEVKCEQVTFL